ncbi:MAG: MFS transporter [Anaerolineales bacterium]
MSSQKNNTHDPYAALRQRDFRLLLAGMLSTSLTGQMVTFAIAWELWLRTDSAFALGLVGLVQVVPIILLSLPGGHVADQYNRKKVIAITQVLLAACSLGLAMLSFFQGSLPLIYLCLLGIGISRAFNDPAVSTLLPATVPPNLFTTAATWSSSTSQLASIAGPALAGLLATFLKRLTVVYALDALSALTFLVLVSQIKGRPLALAAKAATLESLREGLQFIRRERVILAAITLDMFAVLLGGAVTLLPIYATDILKVGPQGLGLMRAAPSIGALLMALLLAHRPPLQRAGRSLLLAVTGFGVATIVFGLSKSFWLSIAMLTVVGGLDNISVVIRRSLILTRTPDELRGRISAVNSIFIGASNELGGFESGLTAGLFGPILSVVGGGIGTLLVVLSVAGIWPEMRRLKTVDAVEETAERVSA